MNASAKTPKSAKSAKRKKAKADDGYIPFKLRFKAWWEGIEAETLVGDGDPHAEDDKGRTAITVDAPPADEPGGRWPDPRLSVARRLWEEEEGDEVVAPGGAAFTVQLAKPMSLDSSKTALDLSAGLGGGTRKLATELDLWMTGMEQDADLAEQAHALSVKHGQERRAPITALDEKNFTLPESKHDGILFRERLYRIGNKAQILDTICTSLKPRGHVVLTDFTVKSDQDMADPAISGWLKREEQRCPEGREPALWTMQDYKAALAERKMDVRIFEDDTEEYAALVLAGWSRFVGGLEKSDLTRRFVDEMMREAEYWLFLHRALTGGKLVYLRTHAIRGTETA